MRILLINPNTTASMTDLIGASAAAAVGPGVTVEAVNPAYGPESLESHYDEAIATPHLLEEVRSGNEQGYDGFVIACFGDPGLLAAREIAAGPVVGIAEAAMHTATYLGRSFSVVTTLRRTLGHLGDLTHQYGVADRCAGLHACDIPVVDLESNPTASARITATCREAMASDGSDVIVLGCAGMADLCTTISAELDAPVVDGVAAATAEVEKLPRLGLTTSRAGEFAPPPVKAFA